mgnify:FL=1
MTRLIQLHRARARDHEPGDQAEAPVTHVPVEGGALGTQVGNGVVAEDHGADAIPFAMSEIADDPRLDPRLKNLLSAFPGFEQPGGFETRDELIAEMNTPEILAVREMVRGFLDMVDNEDVAPSDGLEITEHEFVSNPDGNTVKLRFVRPRGDDLLPCVYYIHGGGMAILSAYDGMYRAWAKIMASQGVAVTMVDMRNCVQPSSAPEVEPFPAGLDDCVSGLKWVLAHAADLGIDPDHVIVAGESGGGNLTLATGLKLGQDGDCLLYTSPSPRDL